MSFKEINNIIKPTYNSSKENIIKNFYNPVLSEAKRYDRISGYFNSNSLAVASKGIKSFIQNKGHMRLLCGAQLSKEDIDSINDASDVNKIICENFLEDLDNIENKIIKNHVKVLAWMIKNGYLEIKIGINKKNGNYFGGGLFHSKFGILWDNERDLDYNDCIIFSGSNNETGAGWTLNIESFNVFKGWEDLKFMTEYVKDFDELWNNENKNLEVMDIPEANKKALIQLAPKDFEEIKRLNLDNEGNVTKELFEHQKNAIDKWFDNNKKGILEMATGTGKTFTALSCLKEINKESDQLITVIACPFSHLVEQWAIEVESLNIAKVYRLYGSGNSNWKKDLTKLVSRIKRNLIPKAVILTTHDTFSLEFFTDQINKCKTNLFLIADEMHHLGSQSYRKGLLNNYNYRLGLSATPSKFMDDEATNFLMNYFDGIVYSFTILEALNKRNPITQETYLTPYNYIPEKIDLTENEIKEYKNLTQQIGFLINNNKTKQDGENLKSKLRRRRNILNNANFKYDKLREILRKYNNIDHLIIFCSDKQIDKVLRILGEENVVPRHRFTSKERTNKDKKLGGISERENLLKKFDNGTYKALVAIKCLDEGVDVPSADKVIIMASTTNPMEYVQRRGRVLRRYHGKEIATIYDMMVAPESNENFVDKIIEKELERLSEFIKTAKNADECNKKLQKWGVLK